MNPGIQPQDKVQTKGNGERLAQWLEGLPGLWDNRFNFLICHRLPWWPWRLRQPLWAPAPLWDMRMTALASVAQPYPALPSSGPAQPNLTGEFGDKACGASRCHSDRGHK